MASKDPSVEFSAIDTDYSQKGLCIKIRLRYKLLGHLTLFEVLNWINSGKGCYAECEDMTDTAVQFAITRLGSIDYAEEVEKIFRYMLEIGFFDTEAYQRDRILTSEGIVRRWCKAKKRNDPASYDLPPSVLEWVKNADSVTETEDSVTKNADSVTESRSKRTECQQKKRKEKKVQTNKQTKKTAESSAAVPPQAENLPHPGPDVLTDFLAEAKSNPRWPEVRLKIARVAYSPGLSADLVDWFTAAALNQWVHVRQVAEWKREARAKAELFDSSKGRAGKAKLWEVLRPKLEDAFAPHGITVPPCNPRRREPPPPPEDTEGRDPATAASRRV